MGRRQDGRIEPGQKLAKAISARAWNRAQDAADIVLASQSQAIPGDWRAIEKASNVVLIRNTTEQTVPIFGVLAISGIAISPAQGAIDGQGAAAARAREFARRPVLLGSLPRAEGSQAGDPTLGQFVIALEPIRSNAIGLAAIESVVQCRVEIVTTADQWVRVKENNVQELRTGTAGYGRIIWKESGTGSGKWALVRLGTFGGVRLGRITTQWAKNTFADVPERDGNNNAIPNQTFRAINRLATVPMPVGTTSKLVVCAAIGEVWHLIAAEC